MEKQAIDVYSSKQFPSKWDMTKKLRNEQLETQAEYWFMRMNSGDFTPREQVELDGWLHESPENARELAKVANLYADIRKLDGKASTYRTFGLLKAAAAVAAVIACVVLIRTYNAAPEVAATQLQHYSTERGHIKKLKLADGSILELSGATSVDIALKPEVRTVRLIKGQAFFSVSPDKNRPFEVHAGIGKTRVLGTEFDIYKTDTRVVVTDLSGSVAVHVPIEGQPVATLTANQRVEYRADRTVGTVETITPERVAAWRGGQLFFSDQSLEEVIAELNRFSQLEVAVAPEVRGIRFSGVCKLKQVSEFIHSIPAILPVRITSHDNVFTIVSK